MYTYSGPIPVSPVRCSGRRHPLGESPKSSGHSSIGDLAAGEEHLLGVLWAATAAPYSQVVAGEASAGADGPSAVVAAATAAGNDRGARNTAPLAIRPLHLLVVRHPLHRNLEISLWEHALVLPKPPMPINCLFLKPLGGLV